ncbi:polyprenyl diphosphate synthase [Patescibacteria group bacterium]
MKHFNNIPTHIAIIMDGNRRWAKARKLPSIAGHARVASDVLEPLVEHASKLGIKYLTFWAFSTENWQRKPAEVKGIMNIFRRSIEKFGKKMHEKGIKIQMIGDLSKFDDDIAKKVRNLIEITKHNKRITVVFAVNYGGRDEMVRAIKKLHEIQNSKFKIQNLSEKDFSDKLDTAGIPDPDLIIRTGGEQRLSGFLLWQSQYSELYFPSFYMPDFTPQKLDEAIEEYNQRKRRFGK